MKALVTGGSGFLGGVIVKKLLADGAEVFSFSRRASPDLQKLGAKTVQGDICDKAALTAALTGVDTVFHVAAKVGVGVRYAPFYEANVIGTQNVIDACREKNVARLVYTSSPSVIFDGLDHKMVDESIPYPERYLAHYPRTKAMAEQRVLAANGAGGLATCALRPHLIWGLGDTNLTPRLRERSQSGKLRIVGYGENIIDTVYVDNAADAHLQAARAMEQPDSPVCGSAYFITQGEPVASEEFINQLLAAIGEPAVKKHVPTTVAYIVGATFELVYRLLPRDDEPPMTRFLALSLSRDHYFDISAARRDFGYDPKISTADGFSLLTRF